MNGNPRKHQVDQLRALLREADPDTGRIAAERARLEAEARIISSLAWAAETLLTSLPEGTVAPEVCASRIGDVARVIRQRAGSLPAMFIKAPGD